MPTRLVTTIRFENRRGETVFFRELTQAGRAVVVRAGRLELTTGQTTTVEQWGTRSASVEQAQRQLDALALQASRQYAQRHQSTSTEAEPEPALTPAVDLAPGPGVPHDANAARVYADSLQALGDVRGELAAQPLELRAGFVQAHAEQLFGELDVLLLGQLRLREWTHGFLTGATLTRREEHPPLATLARDFLALPVARLVEDLAFGLATFESDNDWGPTLREVVASPQASRLKRLAFTEFTSEESELSWTPFGDFGFAWASLPALEVLHLRAGVTGALGALRLPNLRRFVRETGGLQQSELRAITQAHWPQLEALEVWFGREAYGADCSLDDALRLVSAATHWPRLRHLGLVNAEFTHHLLEPLASSPLLPRLESLDLSKGVLRDEDVDRLLRHAPAFARLARLDLSENMLDGAREALQRALPNAVLSHQRVDDAQRRYTAVGE